MRQLVFLYLATINLQDTLLRMYYGNIAGSPLHIGLVLKGGMTCLLGIYLLAKLFNDRVDLRNIFVICMLLFFVYGLFQFVVIEIAVFKMKYIYPAANLLIKIASYLLTAFYVFQNAAYFRSKLNLIIGLNVTAVLMNVIFGYYFKLGWLSYKAIPDSYRGFLAGNDTSIFSALAFGYGLYLLQKHKWIAMLILAASLISMYIISTKAIFGASVFVALYMLHKEKKQSGVRATHISKMIILFIVFLTAAFIYSREEISERVFRIYTSSVETSIERIEDSDRYPSWLLGAAYISPVRVLIAYDMLTVLFSDDIEFVLFGYGPGGIYERFRRPPMMDLFNILGFYGWFGFFLLYVPQFLLILSILKMRNFDLKDSLFLAMFLYGAFGGFLFASANTSIIYGFVSGLLWFSASGFQTYRKCIIFSPVVRLPNKKVVRYG